jgi:hypothetical protein
MPSRSLLAALALALFFWSAPAPAGAPGRDWEPVELTGRAFDFSHKRYYPSYYWAEDFTFLLKEDGGKTWRIISREPTPAYEWRMGPTYTGLKVDWQAKPRVKAIGVKAIDRIPEKFPDLKLDEPNLATALVLFVETKPGTWKEFYVNNWFHKWGPRADKKMFAFYADKPPLYDLYGFARAQAAPFDRKSQAILDRNKSNPSLMFHGRVRTAPGTAFGYEIELIDLIGRDVKSGGPAVLHGDARAIPRLESKK